jgi:hypothetical protein
MAAYPRSLTLLWICGAPLVSALLVAVHGNVEPGADLSGLYVSRRLGAVETLCLAEDGRFLYRSPPERSHPRSQAGEWQPVTSISGALLASVYPLRLYGGSGALINGDRPDPGTFLVSRRSWTGKMLLLPPEGGRPLFQRQRGPGGCGLARPD